MHSKIIRDTVHGDIVLSSIAQLVLGHQHFQRLKRISQNGFLYLVYPGMRHSRFEHALGVYHLSQLWIEEITKVRAFELRMRSQEDDSFPSGKLSTGVEILLNETFDHFQQINDDWRDVIGIAALTHDLGHGPLSHTLEKCDLLSADSVEEFAICPEIKNFFKDKSHVEHEDFTILYLNRILLDLSVKIGKTGTALDCFICRIASLISKDFRDYYVDINPQDKTALKLFSCFISSLFDVDRMDYLRRDSQKAGVEYGNVDIHRIMKTCVPIIFKDCDGKLESGFITSARNVHVLDHFLISLFEMYTILYLHPRNISTDYEFSRIVAILKECNEIESMDILRHSITDEWGFLNQIDVKSHGLLKKLLDRQTSKAQVVQVFSKENVQNSSNFEYISQMSKRPIFKGKEKVFVTEKSLDSQMLRILPWDDISIVAKNLNSESYTPQIWWSNHEFKKELEDLKAKLNSTTEAKRTNRSAG